MISIISTPVHNDATAHNTGRKLARASNGDLHCVFIKDVGGFKHIFHAKSTDEGETWGETALTSAEGNYDQMDPAIAIDSNDYVHIAWIGKRAAGEAGSAYFNIRYIKYTGDWSSIETLTNWTDDQWYPSIAVDSNDYIHITWAGVHADSTFYYQIRYIKYTDSWQSIENLTSGNYYQYQPSIAIDSNDNIHIAFCGEYLGDTVEQQLRYIKYTDSWQAIENLTTGNFYQYSPSITIDSSDQIHIAWHGYYTGNNKRQVRYIKYTDSWQSIVNITDEGNHQEYPSIAIDSDDYIYVVWAGTHSGSAVFQQIRLIKYTDSWQVIENLTSGADHQKYPVLIWALYPVVNGVRTNKPKTEFALVWIDRTDANSAMFYKSNDLTWEVEPVGAPIISEIWNWG